MANRITWLLIMLCGCFESTAVDDAKKTDAETQPTAASDSVLPSRGDAGDVASAASSTADAACGNGVREGSELCDGDCPTACSPTPCFHVELVGAAASCDARCEVSEVVVCADADGCCATGCDHGADKDCSPSCGDGVISGTEKCEPESVALPCPGSNECDDGDPCTEDKVIGSAQQCSAQCAHMPITRRVAGDQCCPAGANIASDADCEAFCGDGVVSGTERCDAAVPGSCPTPSSCALLTEGCERSVLVGTGCDAHCELDRIRTAQNGDQCCPPGATVGTDTDCEPRCGDGVVSGNEECDPHTPAGEYGRCPASSNDCSLPAGDPCLLAVLVGDPQQCNARCTFEPREAGAQDACCPSGASSQDDPDCSPVCGNGLVEDGELCDSGPGSSNPCPTERTCRVELCNARTIVGSGCTAECVDEVVPVFDGDGCCPSGATQSSDNDCRDGASGYWGECSWGRRLPRCEMWR